MVQRELFVWPDVDAALRELMENGEWPSWLTGASAYSYGISIEVQQGTRRDVVFSWLTSVFGPDVVQLDEGELLLRLGNQRALPVEVDQVSEVRQSQLRLLFDQASVIRRPARVEQMTATQSGPVVYGFHSFKGGVGRTTAAIALAQEITTSLPTSKVLLVDADLEAPGISFLIEERWPTYPASFGDLLALANEERDHDRACALIADRIKDFEVDRIKFLPAYRAGAGFNEVGVRPEHLIKNSADPFVLSNLFRRIGRALAVDAVVVDLRAGISEIAAGLSLDPTVRRVFVSTLSGQSFLGTQRLLERVGRWDRMIEGLSVGDEGFEPPHLVLSQVREESLSVAEEQYVPAALAAYLSHADPDSQSGALDAAFGISIVPYSGELESLASTWDKASAAIQRSRVGAKLGALVGSVIAGKESGELGGSAGDTQGSSVEKRNEERGAIERFAEGLEFAESGTGQGFLVTDAIRNLVSDFRTGLPSLPVIGKKGAGKSYMFLQLVRSQAWRKFSLSAGQEGPLVDADVFPVLAPVNLRPEAERFVDAARASVAMAYGVKPLELADCRDRIRRAQKIQENEAEWKDFWIELLCNSVGFRSFDEMAGTLREKNRRILLVADGLEDIFQSLHDTKWQQVAMRALVSEVINWIPKAGGGDVGFVCFVRHDMAFSSVKQNFGQFLQRYKRYALHWARVDALRLVGWVADQSGAVEVSSAEDVDEPKMSQVLIPLWGQKLGSPKANEAHTSDWVLAALSDFRGQVQARDVVRFLKIAAHESNGATSAWNDRVLTPQAIRRAPEICGQRKILDVEQESPDLKAIFKKLRETTSDRRVIPFNPSEFGLTVSELELLEREGVVLRESDGYYMPEMYRQGLGFSLPRGARPKVLALARRAKVAAVPFL